MNNQQQQEPPILQGSTAWMAKAAGFLVALLATPALYEWTRLPLYRYLLRSWGRELADWLIWALFAAEGVLIYNAVVLALGFGLAWFLAWLAARGLGR